MGGISETASNIKSFVSVVMKSKGQDQIEYTGHQRKRSSRAISIIRRPNQEYQVCENITGNKGSVALLSHNTLK